MWYLRLLFRYHVSHSSRGQVEKLLPLELNDSTQIEVARTKANEVLKKWFAEQSPSSQKDIVFDEVQISYRIVVNLDIKKMNIL